jgi:hypothetical protein
MELDTINVNCLPYNDDDDDDDGDEARIPDWETLTRILRHLRRKVTLCWSREGYDAEAEEIQGLATAIHGRIMISEFNSEMGFTFSNFGPWCSVLATLPSLERITLGLQAPETENQRVLVNPEPLKELLRVPALRFVAIAFISPMHYVMQRLTH